jgi:hypothetical protein
VQDVRRSLTIEGDEKQNEAKRNFSRAGSRHSIAPPMVDRLQ